MAIIIPIKAVEDNIGYGRSINQLIELFIQEEMNRRVVKGFNAALIEMFDNGEKPIVHLDDDITFTMEFNEAGMIDASDVGKTKSLNLKDIKNIKAVENDLDPNSAKCFIIKWGQPKTTHCILSFDFRYNKKIAKEKLDRAKDFINASKKLDPKNDFCVLVYLLWSALELVLDVRLWMIPNHKPNTQHKDRIDKLKNISPDSEIVSNKFRTAFQVFSHHKNNARYASTTVKQTKSFNEKHIIETIKILEDELKNDVFLQI